MPPLPLAGEAAGLRIPVAARNRWKQPLHIMHGTVCRSAAPAVRSSGKHAEELEDGPGEGRGGLEAGGPYLSQLRVACTALLAGRQAGTAFCLCLC
jgi:hypothetical protein